MSSLVYETLDLSTRGLRPSMRLLRSVPIRPTVFTSARCWHDWGPLPCNLNGSAKIFRNDKTVNAFNSLWETYEKSSSASVCCGARCCLFCSGVSFGLLLPWTILPIFLSRPLLPICLSRALLSAPDLGCRRQWACRVLSLLVNGLLCAPC